jgi:pyruvate dehydrogenase E2 component (dihydrolipoamide acetyltransferase)
MADFVMPSLGADMEAGTLVKWRIAPGEAVSRGDIIAEVDTEKGVIEIECFEAGHVERFVAQPGDKVPVGAVLAVIRTEGAPAAPAVAQAVTPVPAAPTAPAGARPATAPVVRSGPSTAPGRLSPRARKRAAELGVDLATVTGTGPGGAIEAADVERAAAAPWAPAPTPPGPSLDPMRRAIAAAMAKSKREIPHYYLQTRIDMGHALAWLQVQNQTRSVEARLLPTVILLKAVAHGLRDVPSLNGFWVDGGQRISDAIHLGVAIAMKGGGLVAPAIHDVDLKTPDEIMAALRDLIPRARAGRLRSSEMTDATLTVTALGDLGVETVFGVIYPPQVALVGFGRIAEQPWAEAGAVSVRPIVAASLAADHRATDGHEGARFLDALTRHLQTPGSL